MNPADLSCLDSMLGQWLQGGAARALAPESWQSATAGLTETEAELRLLALAGQAMQVAAQPRRAQRLRFKPDLPDLSLPYLEGEQRSQFQRLQGEIKDAARLAQVLHLLASRRRAMHPLDGLHSGSADALPEVYLPWLRWLQDGQTAIIQSSELTNESWDDFLPAERLRLLRTLRQQQPELVTSLYAAKFATEPAEVRAKLVEVLGTRLGAHDTAFLQSLESDRSGRVKDLARNFLARLGVATLESDDLRELADYFDVKTGGGLFRRKGVIKSVPLKNDAQKKRRAELLAQVDFAGMARALGTEQRLLVEHWQLDDDVELDSHLAAMLERTASDELVEAWALRIVDLSGSVHQALLPLKARLNPKLRRLVAERVLAAGLHLALVADWAEGMWGTFPLRTLNESPQWQLLIDELRKENETGQPSVRAPGDLLFHLALLADQAAAQALLEKAMSLGLSRFDARLCLLQINASLPPSEA